MSLAKDIIAGKNPINYEHYLQAGESLDDYDEYGFTPLIEAVLTRQPDIAQQLIKRGVLVNKPDVTGRTALHWAIDNNDFDMAQLLLQHKANPNAYTSAGLPVLVFPILRRQTNLKHLLYQYEAKLDFAMDFILGKLLGHRFELSGDVDIVTANNEFIELDYEGFILEFTIAAIKDSLHRFTSSFSTRHLRPYFYLLYEIMDAFEIAAEFLQLQVQPRLTSEHYARIDELIKAPVLILPAASEGHAMGFVRHKNWWAKIDRGENSLKEGTVNIYRITRPESIDHQFIVDFLFLKQPRKYFHEYVNHHLGLKPTYKIPISAQITGNCSWANVQAVVPVAYALQELEETGNFSTKMALNIYDSWVEWDKDRALDEAVQRFYLANNLRKASLTSMLGAILYQSCDYDNPQHLLRAEKILSILTLADYYYVLKSYLEIFCVKRLTRRGNNLLKILDDCGVNAEIDVRPVAKDFKKKKEK